MRAPRPLQVSRRTLQVGVILLTVLSPLLARYANYLSARELDKAVQRFEGSVQGASLAGTHWSLSVLTGNDPAAPVLRPDARDELLGAARQVRGSTWSFELFGVTLTDPLAVLESALASTALPWVLVAGVLLPLLLSVVLGRVFCSWICPVGFLLEVSGKLRGLLRFLEIKPGNARLWHGNMYLILGVGLALTFVIGLPILGYLYPPALLGREVHNGVTVMFDRAENGFLGFSAAGLTLASWFLLAIALVELAFGARIWCRSLCPGGAVYSLLGRFRLVRVRRDPENCTHCGECITACQMDLSPMTDRMGMECDNCGLCIASCSDDALAFALPFSRSTPESASPS